MAQNSKALLKGQIKNYANSSLTVYKCYADTLLFADSVKTDKSGVFSVALPSGESGLLRVELQQDQFFYVINDQNPININTIYNPNVQSNVATDSLTVLQSEENKNLYKFQKLQKQINVGNGWLINVLRYYPPFDPFHKNMEDEYFKRFEAMKSFIKETSKKDSKKQTSLANKLALAYYPFNPDWKQSDAWRDSVLVAHYFDYFDPSDEFYLNTNILQEKIEVYVSLRNNKKDANGEPIHDEMEFAEAVKDFLDRTKANKASLDFLLNFVLNRFSKEHKDEAFLYIYDRYMKPEGEDCGDQVPADGDNISSTELNRIKLAEKADVIRGVQVGSIAPDFTIEEGLDLHQIESDYTLLVFWSTWCPYCVREIPEIKKITDEYSPQITTVAVSLDTDKEAWKEFIAENNLTTFLNYSELKSWGSKVVRKYNVYATPTMLLLDKDKKIIAKPISDKELREVLTSKLKLSPK